MQRYVKSDEIADRYGIKATTVRAWARRHWIPVIRAGRRPMLFDPQEVEDALRARGHGGAVSGRPSATAGASKASAFI